MSTVPGAGPAVFPDGARSLETIRAFVDAALAEAARRGVYPVWQLPEPSSRTPQYLRWRRAILVFLLRMPGRVELDVTAERELQGTEAVHPFDVDEVLRRRGDETWFLIPEDQVTPDRVYVKWEERWDDRLVMAEPRVRDHDRWGAFVIANLSDDSCHADDGSVVLASDWPYVSPDDTPEDEWFNESLPAMTTIWFAAK